MVDIHCHIIYNVDDGSDSLEESLKMARVAYENGTNAIVATPHCNRPDSYRNYWSKELYEKLVTLRRAVDENKIPVKIFCGQEVFCNSRTLELFRDRRLTTINNSRYLLVEFDFYEYSSSVYQRISQLVAEGCIPIVAHPERYEFVSEEEDAVFRMKDLGALIQINKGSLTGGFGMRARHNAMRMLDARIADFVASDAHSPYMRTTNMSDAHETVSEMFSLDYAQLLFEANPKAVIADKKISSY